MSNFNKGNLDQVEFDVENLYREEHLTDLKVGSIQVLTPIKPDGSVDPARPKQFVAQAQVMSQGGPLPVNGPIEADTVEEAIQKFPEAVKVAVERMIEEVREMQRQEASRIVAPSKDPSGGGIVMP